MDRANATMVVLPGEARAERAAVDDVLLLVLFPFHPPRTVCGSPGHHQHPSGLPDPNWLMAGSAPGSVFAAPNFHLGYCSDRDSISNRHQALRQVLGLEVRSAQGQTDQSS
jgi:hypothetical protein